MGLIAALWFGIGNSEVLYGQEYHFADKIEAYAIGAKYEDGNINVKLLEYNGGNQSIQNKIGNFSTAGSNRMLAIKSGKLGKYTSFGAGEKTKKRYGQLFFRVGKSVPVNSTFVKMTLVDENGLPGPLVWMDPNGFYRYWNKREITSKKKYSTDSFEQITINYDRERKTYEVWVGKEELVKSAVFSAGKFGLPSMMVIGAAWWTKGPHVALEQWYWKVSGDKPFDSYGEAMKRQPKVEIKDSSKATRAGSPFFINLGDYAKGDGSDETEAIQRAFDAIPPRNPKENVTRNHPGGVLFIPRPKNFYGISKTIRVIEKWNTTIRCETPVWGSRGMPVNYYFRWIGPDNGTMFEFRSSKGMVIENLSMTGMDHVSLDRLVEKYKFKPIARHTKGVTGILLGPKAKQRGFQTSMIFDFLRIANVDVAIKLGDFPNGGPDIREITFRNAVLGPFSRYGVIAASGNLANVTFETVSTSGNKGAKAAFRIDAGELLLLNWNGVGRDVDPNGAEVIINAGGIQIIKAWSEWRGPFLKTSTGYPEGGERTYGSVNYPIILEGVRHYDGAWLNEKMRTKNNPVPLSIIYDRQVPLHLIGCSLWGGVQLGAKSQSIIIDQGTVFIDKDSLGFTGEGITKYGRIIHIGTRNPKNKRILEPYVVDRRNTPGTGPPRNGVWQKGDAIINIEPDPTNPAKAWKGWVCVQPGEPGKWVPFGALEK